MSLVPSARLFDSAWRAEMDRAWERFAASALVEGGVPPPIARSWRRCRELHGTGDVRAGGQGATERARIEPHFAGELLRELRPAVDAVAAWVLATDQALLLLDREGCVVHAAASAATRAWGGERLVMGARWSEEFAGTNGGGTCLVEGTPVHVVASQHHLRAWHPWADAAAPLRDDDGLTCGALVLAGPWGSHHAHTLLAVTALARTIEARLASRAERRAPASGPPRAPAASSRYTFASLVGRDPAFQDALRVGALAARSGMGVVVHGESGTGKELMAHAIHAASERRGRRFVALNCGAIPAELLESELFGYESGAFTGARAGGQRGKFEEADGGTLLLDEIAELSPAGQVALLRVLQERELVRLGGHTLRALDVRVIAATNKDLAREVDAGLFRHDLYYRLAVITVHLPPLRDRPADIPLLADMFLQGAGTTLGRAALCFTGGALDALARHPWPGNVRQLKNVVERVAALSEHDTLSERDVVHATSAGSDPRMTLPARATARIENEAARDLVHALRRSAWNVTKAARDLGVSRMTLYRMLERHGLSRADVLTHALGRHFAPS
jgi:transcriptional regulator of acetoin/glycerol metabolism